MPLRTLAVLVPRGEATWFFKLSGPATAVDADKSGFGAWVGSVVFTVGEEPLTWTPPDDWRPDPAGKSRAAMIPRYATLRTPNGNEAIVTRLGAEACDLLPNVNRWRKEIGLGPAEAAELPKLTREAPVGGVKSTWVDLASPGRSEDVIVAEPPRPAPRLDADPHRPVVYQAPAGWTAVKQQLSVASFRAGEADVSVTPLGGPAGGVAANVNRWREQVGLKPVSEDQVRAEAKELIVEDRPVQYFDLLGPPGEKRGRILAVIVPRGSTTWFVKMRGPADTVARQQAAFELFARSLRFNPGA